jgi:hypothetical protein
MRELRQAASTGILIVTARRIHGARTAGHRWSSPLAAAAADDDDDDDDNNDNDDDDDDDGRGDCRGHALRR